MELKLKDTLILKGIAICCMLWHHLFLNTIEYGIWANNLAVLGKICVSIFLFISGYGLTKQFSVKYSNLTVKRQVNRILPFILNRFIKFYLSYWFCFVIIIFIGNLSGYSLQEAYPTNRNIIKCLLLDGLGIMGYSSYLSTWWFNKLIILLYLTFPLLYICIRNKIVAIVSVVITMVLEQFSLLDIFYVLEGWLFAFMMGMFVAKHNIHIIRVKHINFDSILLILMFFALIFVRFYYPAIRFTIIDSFLAIILSYFVLNLSNRCELRLLSFLGENSTVMYLIHTLFIILLPYFLYYTRIPILIFVSLLLLTLGSSLIIRYIQKKIGYNKLISTITDKINNF